MSYVPVVNDIIEVKYYCYSHGQLGLNVTHFITQTVAGGGTPLNLLLSTISATVPAKYKALMNGVATYLGCSAQRIWPLPRLALETTNASSGIGVAGADPCPDQVAGVLACTTVKAGRKYRGRIFVPFPARVDNDTVPGTPTAGYVTRLDSLGSEVYTPFVATFGGASTTYNPIVWHRADHTYDQVALVKSRQLWGTQRRRGNYGRPNAIPAL